MLQDPATMFYASRLGARSLILFVLRDADAILHTPFIHFFIFNCNVASRSFLTFTITALQFEWLLIKFKLHVMRKKFLENSQLLLFFFFPVRWTSTLPDFFRSFFWRDYSTHLKKSKTNFFFNLIQLFLGSLFKSRIHAMRGKFTGILEKGRFRHPNSLFFNRSKWQFVPRDDIYSA